MKLMKNRKYFAFRFHVPHVLPVFMSFGFVATFRVTLPLPDRNWSS